MALSLDVRRKRNENSQYNTHTTNGKWWFIVITAMGRPVAEQTGILLMNVWLIIIRNCYMVQSSLCLKLKMDTNFLDTFELSNTEHKHLYITAPQFIYPFQFNKFQNISRVLNACILNDGSAVPLNTKSTRTILIKVALVSKLHEGSRKKKGTICSPDFTVYYLL